MRTLLGFLFLCLPSFAAADRIVCEDPIDNKAKMGIPRSLNFSVTEDSAARECRFSIEGVAAGSPDQRLLDAAAFSLSDPSSFFDGDEMKLAELNQAVATMLAAASPVDSADPDIISGTVSEILAVCISALVERQMILNISNNSKKFSCAVINNEMIGGLASTWSDFKASNVKFGLVIESLDLPRMVIRNERGPLIEYLFIAAP